MCAVSALCATHSFSATLLLVSKLLLEAFKNSLTINSIPDA